MDEKEITKQVHQELFDEFLAKLNKIEFTHHNGYELTDENKDWRVKLVLTLDEEIVNSTQPVWLTTQVYYQGEIAKCFTCTNIENINKVRVWFLQTTGWIDEQNTLNEMDNANFASNAFNNL